MATIKEIVATIYAACERYSNEHDHETADALQFAAMLVEAESQRHVVGTEYNIEDVMARVYDLDNGADV